jgi:diguanylate cyclase (GGDEF)-like protein
MRKFPHISIRRKLTLIILTISTVSLLLASAAFITTDRLNARKSLGNSLATMADIIAANSSAAILFGDNIAARETLGFLKAQKHIQIAAIYGPDGKVFAGYRKAQVTTEFPELGMQPGNILYWSDHVELFTPVIYKGERAGTVYIRSDIKVIHDRLVWFLGIVAVVLLASLAVTFVLGAQMQRIITDPLLRLSAIARRITTDKNYSLRVANRSNDEIGNLITDFNAMLNEIQHRDKELNEHKSKLEERVTRRTSELEVANRNLETSREQAESVAKRMQYHAHHDALTGLPNRVLFTDRINTELKHARRQRTMAGVLFLDLDRFKIINDSLGHGVGDQLLRAISRRISSCIRESDTVARLGGDEFMVLLPRIKKTSDAGRIGNKIINALLEPISCNGHELQVTTSVGISIFPHDGADTETLIKNADISMYHAKEQGRNKVVYYTEEMNVNTRKRLVLETSLRGAIERNELRLLYQPKIDITRGIVVGVEALLRWKHPTMGVISPLEFIPVAEESGLITPIGEWVLNTAFRQLREWHDAGYDELTMAVNLSSIQLSRPGFEDVVEAAISNSGIDAGKVELEVTENVAMLDIDAAVCILEKLKATGISIAMDDFGTGYSSLGYLRRLPIDIVKIDRSFVREIPENNEDALIAQAIIAMTHSLNLSLVVEGIENVKQLNFFRQLGCHVVQGFLFSKPVPPEELVKILEDRSAPGTINLVK